MTAALHLLVAFAFLATAGPAPSREFDPQTSPLLRAEHCYAHSPDEVVRELVRAGWFDCEACVDDAMELYAERVRPLVDERCPGAAAVRDDLVEAVAQFDQAFARVTRGNWFGHECARHEAYVDWMIIQAWRTAKDGPDRRKGYTHADLAAVMRTWYAANVDEADPATRPSPAAFTATVNTALTALARAEWHCTPAQAQALRRQVMRRLAKWL